MKMKWKTYKTGIRRAGLVALTGVILWTQPFYVFATAKAEREKQEAQQGLDEANQRADEAQQRINSAQSEVAALSNDLSALIADITLLEADIDYKNEQIHQAQEEYDAAKTREEEQYEAMKKRIKYMYERGETEYLDILLQVKSMTELLNKSEYIEALYTYDRQKLNEFQETKLAVKQYKGSWRQRKPRWRACRSSTKSSRPGWRAPSPRRGPRSPTLTRSWSRRGRRRRPTPLP